MKIGVIGTGNIGGTLARKLSEAGHTVKVANSRGVDGVRVFAGEINAEPTDIRGAVTEVEAVILSIPLPALSSLSDRLFAHLPPHVPVIDTSNYYPGLRDAPIAALDHGLTESEWVQEQIGHPVVKAFNNILADSLADLGLPQGSRGRLAVAVAGDHPDAVRTAMSLVNDTGFDPVFSGPIAESWRQQPCTPSYCCDWEAPVMLRALAIANKGEGHARLPLLYASFAKLGEAPSHEAIIENNRAINWPF
ncbi:3-hydroxyisobutyrate dehydrogenase [Dickeya dianthicola]|uniref:NADPH-dependent F420 reductase n=1 Tax=Dickeya dianthicola TaxID=204039 RepID=UPI00136830F1|nr:NAD(P)-binding domain-containing protein [Dickeya dianthicola]MCI4237732.1 NAD(P)-binding domain-containing protein [Dickeya dianthicola]MCI4256134.1 NAD(P)-binding domain-containing protein [Dickeya dianthicola]MZG23371.1 3-hydroxyisobutyrate dehydrogenase [Dickeya dianthicola]MZI90613.1 3-hydroxyisobutyrate dehydrogenase [Dickeya dianthicola]